MTSETKTLIEFGDVGGVEFTCRACSARILYPLDKHYKRIAERCPNCSEVWFAASTNPNAVNTAEEVKRVMVSLQTIATSPAVLAQVRLCIAGVTKS